MAPKGEAFGQKVSCLQANIVFPFNLFNTSVEFRIRLSTANAQVMYDKFKQYVVQIIAQIGKASLANWSG